MCEGVEALSAQDVGGVVGEEVVNECHVASLGERPPVVAPHEFLHEIVVAASEFLAYALGEVAEEVAVAQLCHLGFDVEGELAASHLGYDAFALS